MIVTYKREWAIVRIEDIRAIQIIELEKAENHSRKRVEILKKIISDIEYKQAGYKYVVVVETSYGSLTLPMKKLGNEEAAQMLFDGSKEIKYVKISEEEGVVEVKLIE